MPGSGETVTGLAAATLMSAAGMGASALAEGISAPELAEEPPHAHNAIAIVSEAATAPLALLMFNSMLPCSSFAAQGDLDRHRPYRVNGREAPITRPPAPSAWTSKLR